MLSAAAADRAAEVTVPAGREELQLSNTESISGCCPQAKEAIAVVSLWPLMLTVLLKTFPSARRAVCSGGAAGRHSWEAAGGDISPQTVLGRGC